MKGQKSNVVVPGLVLGLAALVLVAGFGVLLPKVVGHDEPVDLPAKLSGGYVAMDVADNLAVFEGEGVQEGAAAQVADQLSQQREYGDHVLDEAYEVAAATRTYVSGDGQVLATVTVIRAGGEAVAPSVILDPNLGLLNDSRFESLVDVDGVTCVTTQEVNQQMGQIVPVGNSCRRSEGEFTLQVAGQAEVEVIAGLVDRFWGDLASQA